MDRYSHCDANLCTNCDTDICAHSSAHSVAVTFANSVTDSTSDGRSDFGSFGDTYCRSNQVSDASTYHCSYDNTHVPTHYSSGSCRQQLSSVRRLYL